MENGDDGGLTGRMSGRAKPKKDYSTIHRVGSTDLTKQISQINKQAGGMQAPQKANSMQSAKQRGIQVNN